MPVSGYIIQDAPKTRCPKCGTSVTLLCPESATQSHRKPWFYICWPCHFIAELGKGEVRYES